MSSGFAGDAMLQRLAFEQLHHDEGRMVELTHVVNGADVGMVQGRCGAGLALEPFEGLGVR